MKETLPSVTGKINEKMTPGYVTFRYAVGMEKDFDLDSPNGRLAWARTRWLDGLIQKNATEPGGKPIRNKAAVAARLMKVDEHTYRAYERPGDGTSKSISYDYHQARKFGGYMGVRAEWLLDREGEPFPDSSSDSETFVPDDPSFNVPDVRVNAPSPATGDMVQIRQIDLRFGMGGGATPAGDHDVGVETMEFPRSWLRQFTHSQPSSLYWATGTGDSMAPTINDSDVLLIDSSQREPNMGDKVWAITQYGHGMIKRLRPNASGYTILSDNRDVPPDQAIDGSMDVLGRVVAVVRRI